MARKILNYITPIFFSIEKNGDIYLLEAATDSREKGFSSEFSLSPGLNKTVSIENTLAELGSWLPQTRRFFCSSKELLSCVTPEFITTTNDVLVKTLCKSVWAEVLSYFNVDSYLGNIGLSVNQLPDGSTLSKVRLAYGHILQGDYDNDIVETAWKAERTIQDFKKSMTWVEQARGGQTDPNELFAVCGNHMLGEDFDISAEKESIFKLNHRISILANRATALADIEEISILSVNKVYIDIKDNHLMAYVKNGANVDVTINFDSPETWNFDTVLPVKRVFIGYGKETLEAARNILMNLKADSNNPIVKLFEEICSTYIDLQKPFVKTLIGKNFEDMLNIFGIKSKGKKTKDLEALDDKILDDVVKAIEICTSKCSEYLVPMDTKKFNETYKGLFQAVFGQAFKYLYSVSTDV